MNFKSKILGIILTLSILSGLNANEIKEQNNWRLSGEFNDKIFNIKKTLLNKKSYEETGNYISLEMKIKYHYKNFRFNAVPYAYKTGTKSSKNNENANFHKLFNSQDLFFRGLYISYNLSPKILVGMGIVPMGNGFPMEYTKDYMSDGEGLSILSDIDPLGIFFKFKINENHKILVNFSQTNTLNIPSGMHAIPHLIDNTKGMAVIHKFSKGKIHATTEYIYANTYYTKHKIAESNTIGFGIVYDDSEFSGWSIYDSIGFSRIKNLSNNAKFEMLADSEIDPKMVKTAPSSFNFGTGKIQLSAANLLGIRKDFETFGNESFINFEWFHTKGGWLSSNVGAPYTGNCTQLFDIRNNSYFINYGYRLGKSTFMQINYAYLESKEALQIGGVGSSLSQEEYIGIQRKKTEITKIVFSYRF